MRKKKIEMNPVRKKLKLWIEECRMQGLHTDQLAIKLKIKVQTFMGCLNKDTISSANRSKLFENEVINKEDELAYMKWCQSNGFRYSPILTY